MKTIASRHKVALTGTPIQNGPEELWALFDALMPGFLGGRAEFRRKYAGLSSRNQRELATAAKQLRERTNPFVLRRLKKDVAKDLPEKFTIDRTLELKPRQARNYKELLAGQQSCALQTTIQQGDWSRSSIHLLALLQKLKDVCNHPSLVDGGGLNFEDSAKLEHLQELLEEVQDGGHRSLLFSPSTRMLDIIGQHLNDWNYNHVRLDGSTPQRQRQELVNRFNTDQSQLCFLISTKAGGTGLNLVGADTVILYDHDWNPANDQQAIDRAYRIGQNRDVTVYRLISKGTLEETILRLQLRKAAVADAVIGADADGFKHLTKEELLSLFSYRG